MDSTKLTKDSEERIDSTILLLIAGAAAAFTGLVYYLLKKEEESFFLTDPPPIVIKTGSFIIDSVEGFKDSGNISGNPKRKKVNKYNGDFGIVTKVLINLFNEQSLTTSTTSRPFGEYFPDPQGLTIRIWFQKLTSQNPEMWDQNDIQGEPDVINRHTSPLELELPDNLTKNNQNNHYKRKNRDKINFKKDSNGKNRHFRIGRVQILAPNGQEKCNLVAEKGDKFYISLWDK